MRVPQVNERVKEAPAQALRAMFAGIGQLMLFTDKLRNRSETDDKKAPEAASTPTTTTEKPAQAATAEAAPAAEARATTPAAPTTETVEAAPAPAATATKVAEEPAKAAAPRAAKAPTATAAAAPTAAAATTSEAADLPLPNYDGLTVASLRARMRNLNADQLTVLIGYEKAHANREEIIGMFERRIAKLAEG